MNKFILGVILSTSLFVLSAEAELVKTYFKTGELKAETHYLDGSRDNDKPGIKNGIEKVYYQMGAMAYQVNYINGKRDGALIWRDKQGRKLSEVHYDHGKIVGDEKIFFAKSGHLKHIAHYENDKKEGLQKEYYDNGQLALVVNYVHGKKEGLQKEYTYDGKLFSTVNYKNNYKEGLQKWYDANGKVVKTELFKMDRPVNVMKKIEQKATQEKIVIHGLDFSPNK